MQFNTYIVKVEDNILSFEFFSTGPKGKIRKRVSFFSADKKDGIYNLGFGDVDIDNQVDDRIVTNNGDSQKILLTVAYCTAMFFETHPGALVYIEGSTASRTRLYRIGIANNLSTLSVDYLIFGYQRGWQPFETGNDYRAFLIKKKSV